MLYARRCGNHAHIQDTTSNKVSTFSHQNFGLITAKVVAKRRGASPEEQEALAEQVRALGLPVETPEELGTNLAFYIETLPDDERLPMLAELIDTGMLLPETVELLREIVPTLPHKKERRITVTYLILSDWPW